MHELTKILTISDFNAELVSRYLSTDQSLPRCSAVTAEYGQVSQTLAGFSQGKDLTAFVWTRPEGVIPEYLKVLDREAVQNDRLLAEVVGFFQADHSIASGFAHQLSYRR